ncbi:hypothetical protein IFM89_019440 [Coptis chinensis]|uniref:Bifunctional inhibitor/plant lipid transfer protein/seed storage helical domain-containing protein n=1 Tax=Coptis chinensis TaxID=261450 RepID=A0A835HCU7_9MAGN|nr:hypothetical protein IFM89_019440 [Coptis chinensis]
MASLRIVSAVLLVLLALAEASVHRTIVTLAEVDDEANTYQSERCHRQLSQMRMDSCRQYLQPYMILRRGGGRVHSGRMQQCCQELEEVNQECRCEALRQMMQRMEGRYEGEQQMEETVRRAQRLPNMCGMEPQYCKIPQRGY